MPLHTSAAARLASVLSVLKGLGVTDRRTHLRVLREALENHPHYLGVWAVWEPDALDGNDAAFANGESHDATGRFKPFWHRRLGEPRLEVNQDCDDPVLGTYYQRPVLQRRPVIVAPYSYPVGGTSALLATVAAPIMRDNRCLGAAGVDFDLDSLVSRFEAAPTREARHLLNDIGAELEAGMLLLNDRMHLVAKSTSADALFEGFVERPIQLGEPLPARLRLAENSDSGPSAVQLEGRGVHLTITHARTPRNGWLVAVVSRCVAEPEVTPLSSREDEVMVWLAEGKTNEEIGIILSISAHTVKNHLDRIYRKIGVDNRHAATLAWSRAKALSGTVSCP
jgi:DNA-binding CsgD family transcriptional regulator